MRNNVSIQNKWVFVTSIYSELIIVGCPQVVSAVSFCIRRKHRQRRNVVTLDAVDVFSA